MTILPRTVRHAAPRANALQLQTATNLVAPALSIEVVLPVPIPHSTEASAEVVEPAARIHRIDSTAASIPNTALMAVASIPDKPALRIGPWIALAEVERVVDRKRDRTDPVHKRRHG